jgi:hypothetical protein
MVPARSPLITDQALAPLPSPLVDETKVEPRPTQGSVQLERASIAGLGLLEVDLEEVRSAFAPFGGSQLFDTQNDTA